MSGLTSGNGAPIEANEPSSNGEPVFRAKLNNDRFRFSFFVCFSFFERKPICVQLADTCC